MCQFNCRKPQDFIRAMIGAMAFAGIALSSCSEVLESPQSNNRTAVFRLALPHNAQTSAPNGTRAVQTRALTDESTLNNVDILAFKVDPSDPENIKKGAFFYRARGTYDAATQTVQVELLEDAARQTLVVLANLRSQVDGLGAALNEPKETVMNRLLLPATADGMPDFTNGMPMWGELTNQLVNASYGASSQTTPKPVNLIRSVSRLTLNCSNTSPRYFFSKFDGLYLYNPRTKGRATPDNFNTASIAVTTPTIPAVAIPAEGTFRTLIPETGLPANQISAGAAESFYLFEANSRSTVTSTSALGATCLIAHVEFSSTSAEGLALRNSFGKTGGYYRIDIKDYATDQFLDLLRGHDYSITVEKVDGKPADTADQAYKGNHTLRCKIVPWNEVQEKVIVNGNSRIIVDKRVFDFDGDIQLGTAQLPVNIRTENATWTLTGQPSWITLSQTTGISDTPTTVTIRANSKNMTSADRNGTIMLTAKVNGQDYAHYMLHVRQNQACGTVPSMKLMRIGGGNYQTTRLTATGPCWMIDASNEGGPDMAARPRTYVFAAATIGPIYFNSIPHRACPDGWRLPTALEVANLIQTIPSSYPVIFTQLTNSGGGRCSGSLPPFTAPTSVNESYLAIWTQTPMTYGTTYPRTSPASVLNVGGYWTWISGSTTETRFTYAPSGNRWALVHGSGNDIISPAGLPFTDYYGVHYLTGGSVRCVRDQ